MGRCFLFVGNSPYSNHGSEAIVRGTVEILRRTFDDPQFVCVDTEIAPYSDLPETDPAIVHKPVYYPLPRSLKRFRSQLSKAILGRERAYDRFVRQLLPEIEKTDAVMFLGGDSFAGRPFYHLAAAKLAIKCGKPTVLWGASVGPFAGSSAYQQRVFRQKHIIEKIMRFNACQGQ